MRISIAMATCDGEAFLDAQLQSFVQQTRQPDELVVCDDRSSDSSPEIVRSFAQTSPFPVRLVINEHRLGVAQNFNRALSMCDGDLILLSDQDDVWLPQKIAVLEQEALHNPNTSCFINDALLTDRGLRPTDTTKQGQIRAAGLPEEAMVMGCCSAFRRDLLNCLLPIPDSQRAHDNWLVQIADLLQQTLRLSQPLQFYRRHGDNVSDYFVNRLRQPSRIDSLADQLRGFVRRITLPGGLSNERRFLAAAWHRIAERQEEIARFVGVEQTSRILAATELRVLRLGKRCSIRSLPRYRRLPGILALWRDGGYEGTGVGPGMLKDMLIGATPEDASPS